MHGIHVQPGAVVSFLTSLDESPSAVNSEHNDVREPISPHQAVYGARQHNWPLFVIAAILLYDVERRQFRYGCKAGNESYPTPLTACVCDVRSLINA